MSGTATSGAQHNRTSTNGGGNQGSGPAAQAYIEHLSQAAGAVQASVRSVDPELGVLTPQGPLGNVNQFVLLAQQASASINSLRWDFAAGDRSGDLGQAEAEVSTGANDLANAMSALVTYTESPSSATLVQFLSQYQNARGEWDNGIRTIWRIGGAANPPAT